MSSLLNPNTTKLNILDIGSGSGVIGISLIGAGIDVCKGYNRNNLVDVVAIDVFLPAVELSVENSRAILSKYTPSLVNNYAVHHCSFQDLCDKFPLYENHFDIIVSNPPYIPSEDMPHLDGSVINYESHIALDGGRDDGLNIIKDIIRSCKRLFRKPSKPSVRSTMPLWMETACHQGLLLKEWSNNTKEGKELVSNISVFQDFTNRDRIVRIDVRI